MEEKDIENILIFMKDKSNEELREILGLEKRGEWREEALEAAKRALVERGQDPEAANSQRTAEEETSNDEEEFTFECGDCGAAVDEADVKCPNCGTNIEEVEDVSEEEGSEVEDRDAYEDGDIELYDSITTSSGSRGLGIALIIIGALVGAWTLMAIIKLSTMRLTAPTNYEIISTFTGVVITAVLLIFGFIKMSSAPKTVWEEEDYTDNDEADYSPTSFHDPALFPPMSIADEIKKFAELRDADVISEEEFQTKKNKLLK